MRVCRCIDDSPPQTTKKENLNKLKLNELYVVRQDEVYDDYWNVVKFDTRWKKFRFVEVPISEYLEKTEF
jgi:hypothetical protein